MILTGTMVNCAAIIMGGVAGIFIKGGIKENYRIGILNMLGLATMFLGISTAIKGLMSEGAEDMLFIISLVLGICIGEFFDLEAKMNGLGKKLEKRFSQKSGSFSEGFVTCSITFCVGTMSILGALESGISNEHGILLTKSVLDGTFAVIFASAMGIGVAFSAIAVFFYEGIIVLMASCVSAYITDSLMNEISIVGGILIFAIGCNVTGIKKFKVGNMLPAVFIPIIYYLPFVQNAMTAIKMFFMQLI